MAPPSNPAATPAATPRCAWAGAGTATAETANALTATSAINVFFMASPLLEQRTAGNRSVRPKVPYFAPMINERMCLFWRRIRQGQAVIVAAFGPAIGVFG